MAYPFLLDIPIPGLTGSRADTSVTVGPEPAHSMNVQNNPDISEKLEYDDDRSHPSAVKQEQLEDASPCSISNSAGSPALTSEICDITAGNTNGTSASELAFRSAMPVALTPTVECGDACTRTLQRKSGSRPVFIDLTADDVVEVKIEGDVSSTPSIFTGRCEANPMAVKEEPESTSVPIDPNNPCARSGTPPSVKQDPEDPGEDEFKDSESDDDSSENHPNITAGNGGAPRGTKRPSDCAPENVDHPPRKKRGRAKKAPPPPIYKATAERAKGTSDIPGALDIDDSVLVKIKKCFERAEHKNASDAEARAALFLAGKMMRQYNVVKAEVMQYKTAEEQAKSAEENRVVIERSDGKAVAIPIRQWISDLARAMMVYFDVKSYSSTPRSRFRIIWVFYGIAHNTASAAIAFEKIYNLIMNWSRAKKGITARNSYCLGITWQLNLDAEKKKADEMEKAKKAESEEITKREKDKRLQRQKELERLQSTVEDEPESMPEPDHEPVEGPGLDDMPGPDFESSQPGRCDADAVDLGDDGSSADSEGSLANDDDSDVASPSDAPDGADDENDEDYYEPYIVLDEQESENKLFGNIDDEIEYHKGKTFQNEADSACPSSRRPSPSPPPSEPTNPAQKESPELEPESEPHWKSPMQLKLFRETARRIVENYLKSKGIKPSKSRPGAKPKDLKAFREGKRDARKIDVHQKALEDRKEGEII
ncbi:hypothetical protein MPH_05550 [Macrophomina phaseolina MS6]|uniref:Uncharacterized protein n=1 Tax=Macrophomina phaseolina (strain MS6) TaxID=1126212 RepID=K2SK73_MACPH|nr:hypothetical protein MPH_05550 [Macrophomina phaseolina MS6]